MGGHAAGGRWAGGVRQKGVESGAGGWLCREWGAGGAHDR